MRTILLAAGHSVALYQSPLELPARRHLEYQCRLVQDAGIGSTMTAVAAHFDRLSRLLAAGKTTEASDELANLHYNLNFALEKFSPQHLAFACLVAQVDDKPVDFDPSEEGLQALVARLSDYGLTQGHVEAELETVKKNSILN